MATRTTKRTEVKTEVVFLGKLVERVTEGKLRIPRFQRPFVWRHEDMLALLDSVQLGYPIGSILVWETASAVNSRDRVGPISILKPTKGIVSYILDGQQRVSTLIGTLQLSLEAKQNADEVDWRIYYDLTEEKFTHKPHQGLGIQHFPVYSLLSTAGFLKACREIENNAKREARQLLLKADKLANAFRDYQVPIITIKDANLDTAVTVFARLNRRGRRIAPDQMVSALTYREGEFDLSAKLDTFQDELAPFGFDKLDRVFIVRAVLAAMGRDIYAKDWADLMVKKEIREELPDGFDRAAKGIRAAIKFLRNLGVTSDRLLPYGLQIVLLSEFFRNCSRPSNEVSQLLSRWFWTTSFSGWFGGMNSAQAREQLTEMQELALGKRKGIDVVERNIEAQPFPRRFDARSARVRSFLLYLSSFKPLNVSNETASLEPGALLSDLGPKALGYLLSGRVSNDIVGSPANRMFVDRDHVGQVIGSLEALQGDALRKVLKSHGFPEGAEKQLRDGDREGLIESRLQFLIDGEKRFLKDQNVKPSTKRIGDTVRDSDVSEEE